MLRRILSISVGVLALAGSAIAEENTAADAKTIELTVAPKPAPDPMLKYRLLPLESERTPGDAVPIYLRLSAEMKDVVFDQINAKSTSWLDGPMESIPVAEARKFLGQFHARLRQMEYGSRRQTATWNYTLPEEREHAIEILLPDAQQIRVWLRLLAIKARVEIAEKKYDDAIRTIETGLSMSRHIAEGPFMISSLVGMAGANLFLNRLEELVQQPDAPNLYWALTALPRPMVEIRSQMENEQVMLNGMLPEINDLDAQRTDAEWSSRLARLHARWNGLAKLMDVEATAMLAPNATAPPAPPKKPTLTFDPDFAKFQADLLPEARAFVKARQGSIDGFSDARVILLYLGGLYREIRDRSFAPMYLTYTESQPLLADAFAKNQAMKGPAAALFSQFIPAVSSVKATQVRLDRRIAALRAIEALRMQAAASNGSLPKALDEVKIVPVPLDPSTGRAFEMTRDGDADSLALPGIPAGLPATTYRIRLKK